MFQYLFLGLTFPLWFIQALYVKYNAIRLPEAVGQRSHHANDGISLAILGDSVAAGVGIGHIDDALAGKIREEMAHSVNVQVNIDVLARTGDKLSHLIDKVSSGLYANSLSAQYIVVSIGVNDVTKFTSSKSWFSQLTMFCDHYVDNLLQGQTKKLIFIAIPPMEKFPLLPFPLSCLFGIRAKKLNLVTQQVIKNYPNIEFLPIHIMPDNSLFAKDGFHPSQKGCNLLAKDINEQLLSK